ncbi:AMP-dependent synthetase and ligase [Basidiobolus meristosporus CBS 931.73]|uniref:AMP-dependent synthetase and ligase n=1 Tax=Basidiobolus meristosporus CBS 931.73 TaxID=1314790 RepID=A0A1Y1YBQ1_9FUNG|nr:AMP-dependent synthetase and ligase [Basidiobolus meristosporus CBS 931.73]|eukprot:ORX95417.1 AMP-dependent synthetase and ligase [Basidiobolus meristosporus CBS 931.73]
MLAVLKAYVPIDPHSPIDRNRLILSETTAKLVVTSRKHRHLFWGHEGVNLTLVEDCQHLDTDTRDPKVPGLNPTNLCYVLFTSGSTGTPKGVMLEHKVVANFLTRYRSISGFGPKAHQFATHGHLAWC